MKRAWPVLFFLSATIKDMSASTGERSDDFLVVLVPLAFLTIVWAGYEVKRKMKAKKEAADKPDNAEESPEE